MCIDSHGGLDGVGAFPEPDAARGWDTRGRCRRAARVALSPASYEGSDLPDFLDIVDGNIDLLMHAGDWAELTTYPGLVADHPGDLEADY